jgi:TamB, inner membrane protein subunit of TAM complex
MALIPREDRLRLVVGVIAGTLSALVVVALWLLRSGGAANPGVQDALMAGDTASARAASERTAQATTGPLIGRFQRGVEERLRGADLPTRPLRGPLSVRAQRIRWLEPGGRTFAQAPSASARVDLAAAQRGDILVTDVVLSSPDVTLREGASQWNYEVVLAELLEGGDGNGGSDNGAARRVIVRDTRVTDAHVEIIRPADSFTIDALDATLPVIWFVDPAHPDPTLRVAEATAILNLAEREPIALAAQDAEIRLTAGPVAFEVAQLAVDEMQLADIEGAWNPEWAFPGLDARGRALDIAFSELTRYAPPDRLPAEGSATFTWSIEPLTGDRVEIALTELTATSGASSIAGAVTLRLGGTEPFALVASDLRANPVEVSLLEQLAGRTLPYDGRLTGAITGSGGDITFDLLASLHPDDAPADRFETALRGTIAMGGPDGFTLRGLEADLRSVPLSSLRAFVPGLPFGGTVSGTVSLAGMPDRTPLGLDVRLALNVGEITAQGTVDLTGAVPTYDLDGRIIGLDLQSVLRPRTPPVTLTATFALAGSGFAPESANARVQVNGRFSGWETDASDTLAVAASVASGVLRVETLNASIATASVDAQGSWRFVAPQEGAIQYALEVSDLEPWEPYIPAGGTGTAGGRLVATGAVSGDLAMPSLSGSLAGENVTGLGWSFGSIDLEYDVQLTDSLPTVTASGTASEIGTPTAGDFASATLDGRLVAPEFNLTLRAERADGRAAQVIADGRLPSTGDRELVLRQLYADVEGGRWELLEPATIDVEAGGTVFVGNLEMVERVSGGRVLVDGAVWPLERADARVEAAAIPVGELQELFGITPLLLGDLAGSATIRTAAGIPTIDLTFALDSGAIRGVPVTDLEGSLRYADALIDARAVASLDTAGALTAELRVPALLRFDSLSFDMLDEGAVSGTLDLRNLALAPFASATPSIRDVDGRANGRVTLAGTVREPELAGQMQVAGGAATVVPLNQRFTQIEADLALSGRTVTVRQVTAVSEGTATVRGEVVFEQLNDPTVALAAHLQGFRPIAVADREDAAFSGVVTIMGSASAPTVGGRLAINDGYIPIPEFGGPADDFSDLDVGGPESWMDRLSIEGLVLAPANDVWFTGAGATAQLGGEVTVEKRGDAISLQGTLEGERGTYTLQAGPIVRRFEIASAQVRFLGTSEINPAIDIVARRVVLDPGGRQVEVEVRIAGTLRSPRLSLASADLATVPESELLAFLFFGRQTADQSVGGIATEALLEETVLGLAGLELERALISDLGLSFDIFQLRFGGPGGIGGFGAPTVVLGWELGSEFFLTVESALARLGESASFENAWAIRLEWAFDENSRARIGYEPVSINRFLRGYSLGLEDITRKNQFLLEVRRRWTY